jgi:hypothetical protein
MDAIQRLTENVVRTTYEMLPVSALTAAKTFILDTRGVCVAGSTAPGVSALVTPLRGWEGRRRARYSPMVANCQLPGPPWPTVS